MVEEEKLFTDHIIAQDRQWGSSTFTCSRWTDCLQFCQLRASVLRGLHLLELASHAPFAIHFSRRQCYPEINANVQGDFHLSAFLYASDGGLCKPGASCSYPLELFITIMWVDMALVLVILADAFPLMPDDNGVFQNVINLRLALPFHLLRSSSRFFHHRKRAPTHLLIIPCFGARSFYACRSALSHCRCLLRPWRCGVAAEIFAPPIAGFAGVGSVLVAARAAGVACALFIGGCRLGGEGWLRRVLKQRLVGDWCIILRASPARRCCRLWRRWGW